ncbi:MAG: hypothetical protein FWC78_06520 [Defluviitaleaceae bacterium]|nr:hypothetical protein [Defluviitaleaceae bacterium]
MQAAEEPLVSQKEDIYEKETAGILLSMMLMLNIQIVVFAITDTPYTQSSQCNNTFYQAETTNYQIIIGYTSVEIDGVSKPSDRDTGSSIDARYRLPALNRRAVVGYTSMLIDGISAPQDSFLDSALVGLDDPLVTVYTTQGRLQYSYGGQLERLCPQTELSRRDVARSIEEQRFLLNAFLEGNYVYEISWRNYIESPRNSRVPHLGNWPNMRTVTVVRVSGAAIEWGVRNVSNNYNVLLDLIRSRTYRGNNVFIRSDRNHLVWVGTTSYLLDIVFNWERSTFELSYSGFMMPLRSISQ